MWYCSCKIRFLCFQNQWHAPIRHSPSGIPSSARVSCMARSSSSFSMARYSAYRLGATSPSISCCSFLSFNVCDEFSRFLICRTAGLVLSLYYFGASLYYRLIFAAQSYEKFFTKTNAIAFFLPPRRFFAFASPSARREVNHCQQLASIIQNCK